MKEEPDLAASVYWAVAVVAIVVMALLAWFTAAFNVPVEGIG